MDIHRIAEAIFDPSQEPGITDTRSAHGDGFLVKAKRENATILGQHTEVVRALLVGCDQRNSGNGIELRSVTGELEGGDPGEAVDQSAVFRAAGAIGPYRSRRDTWNSLEPLAIQAELIRFVVPNGTPLAIERLNVGTSRYFRESIEVPADPEIVVLTRTDVLQAERGFDPGSTGRNVDGHRILRRSLLRDAEGAAEGSHGARGRLGQVVDRTW